MTEIPLLVQGGPGPSPALHPHRALLPHITYSPTATCDSPCQPHGSPCTGSVHARGTCGIPESRCSPGSHSQVPVVPDLTTPTPRMSISQINVQQFRPQWEDGHSLMTRIPKRLERQAKEVTLPSPWSSSLSWMLRWGDLVSDSHVLTHTPRLNHKSQHPLPNRWLKESWGTEDIKKKKRERNRVFLQKAVR